MFPRTARWWSLALGLLLVAGCFYPVGEKIDLTVCDLAGRPRDPQPLSAADQAPLPGSAAETEVRAVRFAAAPPFEKPTIPSELTPGVKPPPLKMPVVGTIDKETKKVVTREDLYRWIEQTYPPLSELSKEPPPAPGPAGLPLTLADLQRLALANSPLIKQAVANIAAARGAAIQAGLPPNPTVGFENDTIGTTGGAGYIGAFVDQKFTVTNKLQLARAVAAMDLRNAELALRKAETDLATKVRGGYFAVLVASESVRINRALVSFTEEVYRLQIGQLRVGTGTGYDPAYLRALAVQARANLVQGRNRHTSAWKQLAANLGLPGLPLTQLAGRIDVPIPLYEHKEVLARVLANHTDVRTAEITYQQAIYALRAAQVVPIPDPDVRVMVQKDRTGPPFEVSPSVVVSFPLPVWDRNQGGIMQAQGKLSNAQEEPHRVRTALTNTLADAFERYENNRILLGYYRDQILPDLVRVYRGVYQRFFRGEGALNVTDIVTAQQNLATAVGTYVTTLGALWQAVVDVTDLLQTDDMFQINNQPVPTQCVAAIPDLAGLPGLPCCHPCSPLPDAHQRVFEGDWPSADPSAPSLAAPKPPLGPAPMTPSTYVTMPATPPGRAPALLLGDGWAPPLTLPASPQPAAAPASPVGW